MNALINKISKFIADTDWDCVGIFAQVCITNSRWLDVHITPFFWRLEFDVKQMKQIVLGPFYLGWWNWK